MADRRNPLAPLTKLKIKTNKETLESLKKSNDTVSQVLLNIASATKK